MLQKSYYGIWFIIYYLYQLVKSNIQIAILALSPRLDISYGFIEIPLTLKSDFGLLLFSNLVSMTPGSLVTEINDDRTIATVHVIFSPSEKEVSDGIQKMQGMIKRFIA